MNDPPEGTFTLTRLPKEPSQWNPAVPMIVFFVKVKEPLTLITGSVQSAPCTNLLFDTVVVPEPVSNVACSEKS